MRVGPFRVGLPSRCVLIASLGCPHLGAVPAQVESKLFYLDLKENGRGRYLKISEKGNNRERSTIIVPSSGIPWFVELFHYYAGASADGG